MAPRRSSERYLTGDEVRLFRESRQITQAELGEWLGVTKQAIQNYETRGMNRQQALALAALNRGMQPWSPTEEDRQAVRDQRKSE